MKYLVTGGCGFVGTNIAARLLSEGHSVAVADNLSRSGAAQNLEWLRTLGIVHFHHIDIRISSDVTRLLKVARPDVIFHLAGQVAMTSSIEDPWRDFATNVVGTLNVLEAIREVSSSIVLVYSSSNKVYGDLDAIAYEEHETRYVALEYPFGFDESMSLDFRTPYGCSKGAADQYVLDYARMFGLNSVVFRHSTIYGSRQFATADQGWVGWFCDVALRTKRRELSNGFTISGNGKQVRDVLYVDDAVDCYLKSVERIELTRGCAFNIGGGMENSLSLLELFAELRKQLGIEMQPRQLPWRKSDQRVFVANNSRAHRLIGWSPKVGCASGVARMLEWVNSAVST